MKRTFIIFAVTLAAVALIAGAAPAQIDGSTEAAAKAIDLWNVRGNMKTIVEIAEKGGDFQKNVDLLIDQTLHLLRSPKPGGEGYYFADIKKDPSAEPIQLASTKVDAVADAAQFQRISGEIATPYELEISSPLQRAAFKNNGDTYIKSYRVELIIDGAKKTVERKFEDWIRKGTTHTIPLPGIAQWARIEIDAAVNKTDVNHTIIKLTARVPTITDDKRNPYSFPVEQLKAAREYNKLVSKRGKVVELVKSALQGLDYVPGSSSAPPRPQLDAEQLAERLDHILFMLDTGTAEEQLEAKRMLNELVQELKK
jgi:hypothetical protein